MLLSLNSDLPSFKAASFQPGLNIAIAEKTKGASTNSRNAVGKSSFIRILDFMLGASARTDHIARRPEISSYTFRLDLEICGTATSIQRSGSSPNNIRLNGQQASLKDLHNFLGWELFGLVGEAHEPSFRQVASYYLRNEAAGGFHDALRPISRQANSAAQLPLAHLFGLDTAVSRRALDISVSGTSLRSLRAAAKDPIFGRAVGSAAELEAEISTLTLARVELERQLESFEVIEMYAEHLERADELTRRIRRANDDYTIALERTKNLELSLASERDQHPEHSYLAEVFEQVGIVLPERALNSYTEVASFHASVVRNRRMYLEEELAVARESVTTTARAISSLDAQRAETMRLLEAGGALETFQAMQKELGSLEGKLSELQERLFSVQALKDAKSHLQKQSIELEDRTKRSLQSRDGLVQTIGSLFTEFAFRIYGKDRPATLGIKESEQGYVFSPTLGGGNSAGVRSIEIFCFDLAMAVTAHRLGKGPDFLVHDSRLFDAVEARQTASALKLASEVCGENGLQYIVALNSDVLEKAAETTSQLTFHTCTKFTDEYASGGLFGMRFN
ncbi:ABC-three component system protein [Arthrobacter rhombi]|uniref:ABC-three component system protein n=1 Tax=Arthrobacter rhombi TaxID=71253 RepID=UPI003FD5A903